MNSDSHSGTSCRFDTNQIINSAANQISILLHNYLLINELHQKFSPTVDTDERITFAEKLIHEHKLSPEDILMTMPKNNQESLKYCTEGDEYFSKYAINEALVCYNKSIAHAEINSESLRTGYSKRSQVFRHLGLHEKYLTDTILAKESIYCQTNIKLEQHEEEDIIQSATSSQQQYQKDINFLTELTYPKHPKIPFIANCLEVIDLPEFGRTIRTNCDLKPGDVIAMEKSLVSNINKIYIYSFCSHCLRETYSLIPCSSCTMAMFCNQKCFEQAYEKFHKYECKISNYLDKVLSTRSINIRIIIQGISLFKSIDRLIDIENQTRGDTNIFKLDSSHYFRSTNIDDNDTNLSDLNYYTFLELTRSATNSTHLSHIECLALAVETVLANNLLTEIFKDIILTHEHKRFVRNFIHRQLESYRNCQYQIHCLRESPLEYINYGSGLYPFTALLHHSCAPNVIRDFYGSTMIMVVIRPVSKHEQLFDNLCTHNWSDIRDNRQRTLKSPCPLDCKCATCVKDFQLMQNMSIPSAIPFIDLSMPTGVLHSITATLKDWLKFLNLYSKEENYPCQQIVSVEIRFEQLLSQFLRHRQHEKEALLN